MPAATSEGTVAIIGGGIAGLTLALQLHEVGIQCHIFESAESISTVGVGINILPHASAQLARLGLEEQLLSKSVATQESVFYNRFGQFIYKEPAGRFAGYSHPQYSIHRGDLQSILYAEVLERLGEVIDTDSRCVGIDQDDGLVTVHLCSSSGGNPLPDFHASIAIACDGIHSIVRKQFNPNEGSPRYSGVNMWRGTTVMPPVLTGASMIRVGWLTTGKLVAYPIRSDVDSNGSQLMNWVVELTTPNYRQRDWNRVGNLEDFIGPFENWHFDWLDVPEMLRSAERVLEFPMIDQDPLERWTNGRITLLGDAAHPMLPRGSNGAGQAIIDTRVLTDALVDYGLTSEALCRYEDERRPATTNVVLTNRRNPPDAILREVFERTGDKPFDNIDDVITSSELRAITDAYKQVAGYIATEN